MWQMPLALRAANVTPTTRDTLVYKDGDRIHGALVEESGGLIVFKSERFGELRVSSGDAVVIRADKDAVAAAAHAAGPEPVTPAPAPRATPEEKRLATAAAEERDAERVTIWDRFSPSLLTARVREYFGPWHGRFSFGAEIVTDVAERSNSSYEMHVQRKWTADEVQVTGRYDFSQTDDITTTDILKAGGQWRHLFTKIFFAHYRPTSEWNRATRRRGVPNDYVLLQQEIGAGYRILTKPSRSLSVGVAQNLFDTWNTAPEAEHTSQGVVSLFEEMEFTLPWRITISQRGVFYPMGDEGAGFENRIDLNKKLTETLSTSVRHEIRRNNPDGSAQDYTRLKLLFGLDF